MIPVINEYYQHRYGGIYIVTDAATHTRTKEKLVIYVHVYPFEETTYARSIEEWTDDRFRRIKYDEMLEFMKKDQTKFQAEINAAKELANR